MYQDNGMYDNGIHTKWLGVPFECKNKSQSLPHHGN